MAFLHGNRFTVFNAKHQESSLSMRFIKFFYTDPCVYFYYLYPIFIIFILHSTRKMIYIYFKYILNILSFYYSSSSRWYKRLAWDQITLERSAEDIVISWNLEDESVDFGTQKIVHGGGKESDATWCIYGNFIYRSSVDLSWQYSARDLKHACPINTRTAALPAVPTAGETKRTDMETTRTAWFMLTVCLTTGSGRRNTHTRPHK